MNSRRLADKSKSLKPFALIPNILNIIALKMNILNWQSITFPEPFVFLSSVFKRRSFPNHIYVLAQIFHYTKLLPQEGILILFSSNNISLKTPLSQRWIPKSFGFRRGRMRKHFLRRISLAYIRISSFSHDDSWRKKVLEKNLACTEIFHKERYFAAWELLRWEVN